MNSYPYHVRPSSCSRRRLHKDRGRFSLGGGGGEKLKPLVRLILRRALSRLALLRAQREKRNGKEGEEGENGRESGSRQESGTKKPAGERERMKREVGGGKEESEEQRERQTRTRKNKKEVQRTNAR